MIGEPLTHDAITQVLAAHRWWFADATKGTRADLSDADLSDADLRDADLRHAIGDLLVIGPLGSRRDWLVATWHDGVMQLHAGCWCGRAAELRERVAQVHGGTVYEAEYLRAVLFCEAADQARQSAEQHAAMLGEERP